MTSRRTLFAAAAIALAAAGAYAYVRSADTPAPMFFAQELRSADMDIAVTVAGSSYLIEDGIVHAQTGEAVGADAAASALSLAYEAALARRAPLLSIPGVQPEKLRSAALRLSNIARQLAELQKNEADAELVRSALYPTDFLRALADAEGARLDFIASSTDMNARQYEASLHAAADAYTRAVESFSSGFAAVVPEDTPGYLSTGGRVTRSSTLRALEQLRRQANALQEMLARRDACVSGSAHACEPGVLALKEPETQGAAPAFDQTAVERAYKVLNGASAGLYVHVHPAILLKDSACVRSAGAPPVFAATEPLPGAPLALHPWIEYVGDLFLVDTSNQSFPFFYYFREAGVSYTPHSPVSTYSCASLLEDASRVMLALDISDSLSSPEASMLREQDMLATLSSQVRDARVSNISLPDMRLLEERVLAYQNRTNALAELVERLAYERAADMRIAAKGVRIDMSAKNLFYIQSAFPSLLVAHAPSFSGADLGLVEPASLQGTPVLRWSEHPEIAPQKLAGDFRYFILAH